MRRVQPPTGEPSGAPARRRELLLSFATLLGTVVLFLSLAEVVLRFLPVSSGLRSMPVDSEHPVFHFTPDRTYINSVGWNMHAVNRGRINNAGFVNDQDYRRDDSLPMLAVIGDSYIEARMLPYEQTLHGQLARALAGRMRVYSFAAAGAPLSQYLIWARHAVQDYGARALVINVVGNDFDESHAAYRVGPGFWLYAPDTEGALHLRLSQYRPGWGMALARESALARYLMLNLRYQEAVSRLPALSELIFGKPARAEPRYVGNTDASVDAKRVSDSVAVIDAYFRDLPDLVGLAPQNVLFTVDGFRYPQAAQAGRGSYFDVMRRAFLERAQALGYEAIDLDPLFFTHHERTGERMEYEDDGHWNAAGHGVAFEAVMSSRLLKSLPH